MCGNGKPGIRNVFLSGQVLGLQCSTTSSRRVAGREGVQRNKRGTGTGGRIMLGAPPNQPTNRREQCVRGSMYGKAPVQMGIKAGYAARNRSFSLGTSGISTLQETSVVGRVCSKTHGWGIQVNFQEAWHRNELGAHG